MTLINDGATLRGRMCGETLLRHLTVFIRRLVIIRSQMLCFLSCILRVTAEATGLIDEVLSSTISTTLIRISNEHSSDNASTR